LPTISTAGAISIVEPLIQAYYGNNDECKPVSQPLDTITTKDRFGLVEGQLLKMPDGQMYKLDITFRMLQPHELAAAMSFPKDYRFSGTKTEKIKQIGNAVCPKLSESLIAAAISA
jgi:DNA (cytosine-5)-methyltransferase 1